ncbi:hypothetical protein GRX03_03100 [Halovenus sp. WSH3]|uniref:Uncharacterized protein n=1 Tax=Halovenus carboxidivorans TaxID=2692199 RepID=A0A6B0T036_9EURY|nr:hypothetical protein [Halovenus carboxidivorans]MXR50597.1 hypothetical protein [Halovenus carboxidivorans]
MAEFNLHARLDSEAVSDPMEVYGRYTDTDGVEVAETDDIDDDSDPDVLTPTQFLEIEGVETFADIYTDLADDPAVVNLSLRGPTAERFPIPVQHHALQQIGDPTLYEFHALDGQITLVIAESELELNQVHNQVPPGSLG